jgi:hypothetical protein
MKGRIVLSRLGFPKANGGCGQIVTQRDRPAGLKEFQLLDGCSHATLVNIEERFCGLQDHHRCRATSFAKASRNDRRGYCLASAEGFWLTCAHLDAVC